MPDVINKEENLGALDDLSKIANNSSSTLEFTYQLNEFELGLGAAELAKQKTPKTENFSETITPNELLRAVQRDMHMQSQNETER